MQILNQSIFSLSPALSLSPGTQIMLMPTFKRQAGGTKNKAASQLQDKGEHLHARTKEGADASSAKNNKAVKHSENLSVCPFFKSGVLSNEIRHFWVLGLLKQTSTTLMVENFKPKQKI